MANILFSRRTRSLFLSLQMFLQLTVMYVLTITCKLTNLYNRIATMKGLLWMSRTSNCRSSSGDLRKSKFTFLFCHKCLLFRIFLSNAYCVKRHLLPMCYRRFSDQNDIKFKVCFSKLIKLIQ